jgi:hypothetical protein
MESKNNYDKNYYKNHKDKWKGYHKRQAEKLEKSNIEEPKIPLNNLLDTFKNHHKLTDIDLASMSKLSLDTIQRILYSSNLKVSQMTFNKLKSIGLFDTIKDAENYISFYIKIKGDISKEFFKIKNILSNVEKRLNILEMNLNKEEE